MNNWSKFKTSFHINCLLSYKALYQKCQNDSAKPNKMATRDKNRKMFYSIPCSLYCSNDSTVLNKSASRAKYSDERPSCLSRHMPTI